MNQNDEPQPQPSLSSQSEGWLAELPTASTWILDLAYSRDNKSALTRTWLQAGGYLPMAAGPLSWWIQKVWSLASPGRPVENTGAWAPPLEGPAKKVHVGAQASIFSPSAMSEANDHHFSKSTCLCFLPRFGILWACFYLPASLNSFPRKEKVELKFSFTLSVSEVSNGEVLSDPQFQNNRI